MGYSVPQGNPLMEGLKFKCSMSGEMRQSACPVCNDVKSCTTSKFQVKESTVNNPEGKSVVKITADGEVKACAKGLAAGQCGYKPGAKVCGKCGAMAVEVKGGGMCSCDDPVNVKGMCKKCGMPIPVDKLEVKGDKTCSCANPIDVKGMCKKCGLPVTKSKGKEPDADYGVGMEREKDEEVYDEDNFATAKKKEMPNPGMAYVDEPMSGDFKKRRKARHAKKLSAMGGMKSEDDSVDTTSFDGEFDENEDYFMCAASREVKSAGQFAPCADCPGGCFSSDDSLDLIEAEYLAEETLGGKSLFSFFADDYDSFIVQLRRKDGVPVETYFSKTGEMLGWNRIPESEVYGSNTNLVDIETAVGTALEVVEGKALSISVGEYDGEECYVVEIEGVDQKSYDVVVTLDGIPLYKDEFETEEKRLYGTEKRQEMAKEGMAMPDGSYPIKDRADLENAIQAFGRAKDKEATKAHIRKRAAALDLTDLLPEAWGSEEKVALQPSDIESALAELTLIEAQTELSLLSEEE